MPLTYRHSRDPQTPDAAPIVPRAPWESQPAASPRPLPLAGVPVPAGTSLPPGTSYATLRAAFPDRPVSGPPSPKRPQNATAKVAFPAAASFAHDLPAAGETRAGAAQPGVVWAGEIVMAEPAAAGRVAVGRVAVGRVAVDEALAAWRLRNAGRFSARVLSAATVAVTAVALSAPAAGALPTPQASGVSTPSAQITPQTQITPPTQTSPATQITPSAAAAPTPSPAAQAPANGAAATTTPAPAAQTSAPVEPTPASATPAEPAPDPAPVPPGATPPAPPGATPPVPPGASPPAAGMTPAPGPGTSEPVLSTEPSPAWPKGIDIASWQHPGSAPIDWNAVKGAGMTFAIVKATEGTNYTNPFFVGDRDAAGKAGLVVGAYHYARPAAPISTAVDQARHFLAVTGLTRTAGHLAPVLDLETTGGLDPVALAAWTRAFLEEIESQTGRAPILYTYRSFWTNSMADTKEFARYPFWFAIYNNESTPGWLPGGWPGWAMWQYTSSGVVPGIIGSVDMNVVCCSAPALTGLADGTLSEIDKRYATAGLLQLALGAPTEAEVVAGGGGRWRPFKNGLIYWSVATGPRVLHGKIAKKYLGLGGTNSFLGRPLGDVEWAAAPGAHQAIFQGGWIYWHPTTGAHEVHGLILRRYLELGGSTSSLGLPITDEYSVPGGRESAFQFGKLHWTAATNAVTLLPAAAP